MAPSEPTISELTSQLAAARGQVNTRLQTLEARLNVPQRLRDEVIAHPVKWVAISVVGGIVAAKTIPMLLRGPGTSLARGLLPVVLRTVAMAAMPFVATMVANLQSPPDGQSTP